MSFMSAAELLQNLEKSGLEPVPNQATANIIAGGVQDCPLVGSSRGSELFQKLTQSLPEADTNSVPSIAQQTYVPSNDGFEIG